MRYKEEKFNLLNAPRGWTIAHCISADAALGAGVALQIENEYGMREQLKKTFGQLEVGNAYLCMDVFNLVTKEKYWHKPTLDTINSAIISMRDACITCGIHRIMMPKIGCGLDRQNWDDVKKLLQDAFEGLDIDIIVCYL